MYICHRIYYLATHHFSHSIRIPHHLQCLLHYDRIIKNVCKLWIILHNLPLYTPKWLGCSFSTLNKSNTLGLEGDERVRSSGSDNQNQ